MGLTGAGNRSLNKGEMLLKGLIEMVTTVIGAEIGDEAVYLMVEALLPHVPTLQVRNKKKSIVILGNNYAFISCRIGVLCAIFSWKTMKMERIHWRQKIKL